MVACSLSSSLYVKGKEKFNVCNVVSCRCIGGRCVLVHLSKMVACDGIFPSRYPVIQVLVLINLREVCVDLSRTVRSNGRELVRTSR